MLLKRDSDFTSEAGKHLSCFFGGLQVPGKRLETVQRQQILSQMQEEIVNI